MDDLLPVINDSWIVTGVDDVPVETEMLKGFVVKMIVRVLAATLFKKMLNVILPPSMLKIKIKTTECVTTLD